MLNPPFYFTFFLLALLPLVFPSGCNDDDDHFVPRQPDYFCTAFDYKGFSSFPI